MNHFDAIVIGAGAAGMFFAGVAGARGARVLLIDHATEVGEKIRISGGGRCNFTNLEGARVERYHSRTPRFARDALRAFPPERFIALVREHGIGYHEKHRGQLFCDDSSERIVSMLRGDADAGRAHWWLGTSVREVRRDADAFVVSAGAGEARARALVVATGGLSVPKIGASDFGHRIARKFGIDVVEARPALVPLTFSGDVWQPYSGLSGISMPVRIRVPANPDAPAFDEDLLFTHRGLSGPAVLQASTFWRPGEAIEIDLAPDRNLAGEWIEAKDSIRRRLATLVGEVVPRRLGQCWFDQFVRAHPGVRADARPGDVGNRALGELIDSLRRWRVTPAGSEGWRKAEVTAGGVSGEALEPRTMQARAVPGLYFIGEVTDVTGWLGGYNFQWAWSSAYAAAQAVTA